MTLYVDSSALLKRYVDEHDSAVAVELMGTDPVLVTSRITEIEVRRNLARLLDGDSWTDSRRQFAVDLDAFALVGLDATTCNEAAAIAAAAACKATGAAIIGGPDFTIRTLPSPSVISSSAMFDSATRSMRVLSFLRSMGSPVELTNEEGEGGGVSLRAEPADHGLRQV